MKTCKNLSKRGLALFLALVMCLSMVQITAFAVDGHVHNEDGWSCTQDDSVRELSCDKHVHNDNCYQTVQGELTCEAEEHQHGDGCYEAAEPQLTCADAEHTHGDSCYTQGEDVLTCAETEHTHGEDCYAAETVKVCEEEDHQHGDECYTVTEGEWTCTAPVVEEAPAEEENNEAPVTYEVRDTGRTSNVTKSPYEDYAPNKDGASDLPVYNNGMVPDKNGAVTLTGDQKTATDYLQVRYYTNHGGAYATGYTWLTSSSTNKNVAAAKVSQSTLNGKPCLKVDFEAGSQTGSTTIEIGYTVVNLDNEHGIGTGNDFYMYVSGYVYYNVTNAGDGTTVEPVIPDYPDAANLQGITVTTKCTYNSNGHIYLNNNCYKVPRTLNGHPDGYVCSDIRENQGELGTSNLLARYPYACTLTLNREYWADYYNQTLASNSINKTHYLNSLQDSSKTTMTLLYNAEKDQWDYDTDELEVYVTETAPITYTYTVVYTDGVSGEVFGNESHSNLKEGDATPAFNGSTEREGYTFMGWAPTVNPKVSADDATDGVITYTATWQKDTTPPPTENKPDAPTKDDVENSLKEEYTDSEGKQRWASVRVYCEPGRHLVGYFSANKKDTDRVTIGEVKGNDTDGYTCDVTFLAQEFCDGYSKLKSCNHELVAGEDGQNKTIVFNWNAETEKWEPAAKGVVKFWTECADSTKPETVIYKVQWIDEADSKVLKTEERKGAIGTTVSVAEADKSYTGYTYVGDGDERNVLSGTLDNSNVVLKMYFRKNGGENPGPGPGVEPDKAGLKLTKAVDNGNPELGGTVTYTITVSNKTRVALKDLKIKDVMPEGVTLVGGSGEVTVNGTKRTVSLTQDGQTCNWTVDGVIPVDGEVVLTYNATVPGAAAEQITLTNTAQAFANQNEAPAPQMAQGVAQYAASMANDFVSGSASTEFNVKGYGFTSNEDNATVTVKPGGGTNPGPVKPGKPDDGDLNKLKLGVQVVCDVENSNHSVTEYLLKTAECTIGEVTENADTATKEEYPYTCTVQLAASGQNWYLGQKIKDTQDYWNKEHQLADKGKILTATLYHDGEKWTLPIGGGMNPDVAQGTNIKAWKYLVIHTVHKAEQLPGAKDTTYTVVHEYYTNGALTGSNQDTVSGKVGQTVNAEGIAKVTTYGGNSYTYTSANPEILVLADSENTITLRYDRTTGGNGGGNGGGTTRYTLTVRYEYEDGTQAAPTHTERLARGDAYSVDSPVIEGYTPDQAVVSGEMPGRSLTVTVVYTPDGQDIPDEEPPLVDLPDEEPPLVNIPEEEPPLVEIPEEEPPLAETPLDPTPKTGDNSRTGLWAALCGFSLFGMLALLGKKREDEEA